MSPYDEGWPVRSHTSVDEAVFLRSYGFSWHEIAKRVGVRSVENLSRSLLRRGFLTFAREADQESTWCPEQYDHWAWYKQG